jgi:hypothetical protein
MNTPFRACLDRRLVAADRQVLDCIAAFDRMSRERGGDGCYAGTARIALGCGLNPGTVSTSISRLKSFGYLVEEQHPRDGRMKTLRVVYSPVDGLAFDALQAADISSVGEISLESVSRTVSPAAETQTGNVSPAAGKVSRPRPAASLTNPPDMGDKRDSEERQKRDPAGAAPINIGGALARLERRMQGREHLLWSDDAIAELVKELTELGENEEHGSPYKGRADRLANDLAYELNSRSQTQG